MRLECHLNIGVAEYVRASRLKSKNITEQFFRVYKSFRMPRRVSLLSEHVLLESACFASRAVWLNLYVKAWLRNIGRKNGLLPRLQRRLQDRRGRNRATRPNTAPRARIGRSLMCCRAANRSGIRGKKWHAPRPTRPFQAIRNYINEGTWRVLITFYLYNRKID